MMLFKIIDLEYSFKNHQALNKKSLNIRSGDHLLIHGPSGCGKTTLINLMAGLLKPSSGEIFFEDHKYSSLSEKEIDKLRAGNFGFIFQKLHLIGHLNIEQNISLAINKEDSLCSENFIKDLGLLEKKEHVARDLSVGEAQRVAIARGLINKPRVVFADEPTSALDDINAKRVMDLIFSQIKETKSTLIVSTHDSRIKDHFSNIVDLSS